jgi:hypothetical protein
VNAVYSRQAIASGPERPLMPLDRDSASSQHRMTASRVVHVTWDGRTSVESYAARVRGLLFDERLRERKGHAEAIRIKQSFSFDEHVRRYVERYDQHLLARFAEPSLAAAADGGGCR